VQPVEALIRFLGVQFGLVRRVGRSDLGRVTPCPGWSVRDVLEHSIGVTLKFTAFASGATDHPRRPPGDLLGRDHRSALRSATRSAQSAWRSVDPSRVCTLSFGSYPATRAAGIHLVDVLAHTWDVAAAVGAGIECDDELWVAARHQAALLIGSDRDLRHYGRASEAGPVSTAEARFLAYLGRSEGWRPPPP
jgi:uncharacterized protein (TIGR03086 family)